MGDPWAVYSLALSQVASVMMAGRAEIATLHRYYLHASFLKTGFDENLLVKGAATFESDHYLEQWIWIYLWYGCLFVVVEGWQELGLVDMHVDAMLESTQVGLLKRFRNGVFHFQRSMYDERFLGMMREGVESARWARELHEAFGKFFLTWLAAEQAQ